MVNGKIEAISHFSKVDIRRMISVENKCINGKIDIGGQVNFKKIVEGSDVTLPTILTYASGRTTQHQHQAIASRHPHAHYTPSGS
jgi:hypothetical protein